MPGNFLKGEHYERRMSMRLGMKIGGGFGLVLVISLALGGLAIWRMKDVQTRTTDLAEENAPEAEIANRLERSALLTMYEMRGYALSEDAAYRQRALQHLKQ